MSDCKGDLQYPCSLIKGATNYLLLGVSIPVGLFWLTPSPIENILVD